MIWAFTTVLCISVLVTVSGGYELSVLHTNDLHSRFDQVSSTGAKCRPQDVKKQKCFGGVARIKHAVDQLKREHPNHIFVNAGDFFQGTVWYSMFKWHVVANLTSPLGYTASSLGNHEFDDGVRDLEAYAKSVAQAYPLLACNLDLTSEPGLRDLIKPAIVKTIGGQKVAIIGYVTPDTKELSNTGSVTFLDEVKSIQQEVDRLKAEEGVKIFIAVGHSGYEQDQRIAKEVNGLDVVVGGHTNTFLWHGPRPKEVRDVPMGLYPTEVTQKSGRHVLIVQTNGYGRYLGRLRVTFNGQGEIIHWTGNPVLLNSTVPMDPDLSQVVNSYRTQVEAKMGTVVGQTQFFIDGGRPKCRLEECSFGNFVTDAMASEMQVNIAVINSGAIKGSFDPSTHNGAITLHDIYTAMPWSNTIDVVTITGLTLKAVLEHAVSQYDPHHHDPSGRFLQVSGLVVHYDVRQLPGHRLTSVLAGSPKDREAWKPIDDELTYDVAVPSYLALGGDKYQMIPDQMKYHKNTGFLDNDLIISYLDKNNPLLLPPAGRIVVVADAPRMASTGATIEKLLQRQTILFLSVCITVYKSMV